MMLVIDGCKKNEVDISIELTTSDAISKVLIIPDAERIEGSPPPAQTTNGHITLTNETPEISGISGEDMVVSFRYKYNTANVTSPIKYLILYLEGVSRVTNSGDIDGYFFYPPNGYNVSTLRFRYEYLNICDYNVDCWKVTDNANQTNRNANLQNQTQYQSGSSSYNQSNAQSAYQQQLAEAERKRQALLEKQRTEQQQALDQQRQQATQQYNQQMADLQQQQAQIEQSSQQVAEAIVSLLDTEVEALTESDELGILSGGINNLMSPLITSNQTNTGGLGKTSWFFSAVRLSRKGLSFSLSTGGMEQYDEKFSIKAQGTSGNYTVFSGPLTISTFSFAGSVGKDIAYSKNGRFHLFFGPGIGYMMVKHFWKYSASQPAYEESKLSKDQFYWTLDGQMIFMFSQRLGLQGGVTWGGPFSKTDEKALYKLGSFSSYSLGLAFRIL